MKNIQEGQANCSFNNESIINIDPMNELSQMIGITKIKETLEQLLNKIQLDKERSLFGLPVNQNSLHSVFLGNNGLGKTRVINLFGKIFKKHKILSTGLVYYESAKYLVCESVSEMKTRLQTAVE